MVEIDETFVGGKKLRKDVKAGKDAKISALGMVERGGRLHMQTIDNCKAAAIRPAVEANLSPDVQAVLTDSAPVYNYLFPKDKHVVTNHKLELETFGELSTRTREGAFSLIQARCDWLIPLSGQRSFGQLFAAVLLAL
jgi:hypothetical protein